MQTYQSLCMYRQHHKSQIHIKTTHSHQRGVNTLQERCGPEPRERSSCGSCETCTDTLGSVCPTAASLSWSLGWARQQQGRGQRQRQRQRRAVAEGLGWGQSLGSYGREREAVEEIGLGPRGAWRIFSFLMWDSAAAAWKAEWQKIELLIYLSWRYIKLQSLESKHQVKRNQRSYISHHKGFPLPFLFCIQNSPQGIGPLFWGPWGSGLGGSERVLLCPGGGGGGLFLERVELPLEVWVLRGRVEGGSAK